MFERIISCQEVGEEEVFDIEIDSEFHNFYANNILVHNCYSIISWQTLYFKTYYPSYLYSAMINNAGNIEEIQEIIEDARLHEIKILQPSVVYSKYNTIAQGLDTVRLGFGTIKGMGASVEKGLKEIKEIKNLSDVLKNYGEILNKTQFQNFIDIGAFDEFDIDREEILLLKEIYSDESIEKWFTRKKQTLRKETFPKILQEKFDAEDSIILAFECKKENEETPWVLFTEKIISKINSKPLDFKIYEKITIEKQNELMGFTLIESNVLKQYASSFKAKGILPFKESFGEHKDDEEQLFYFVIDKIDVALTKKGKKYMSLSIHGKKVKCWRELDLVINKVYYGAFEDSNFGITLDSNKLYEI